MTELMRTLRAGTRCVAVALSAASLAPPSGLAAQEPDLDTAVFRVTANLRDADTKEALMGALIEVAGHPGRYVTGMHGQVGFDLPAGHYAFAAHKGGYATLMGDFRVVRAGNLMVMMHELGEVDASIPGRLLVRVAEFGSGRLIEGAAVSLSGGRALMTDGRGWVEFRDLSGPVAEVAVESFGYRTRTETVSLQDGRTTVVEVALAIDAVVLAPLDVEARSRFLERQGVYWRLDRGWADHLLTREELIGAGRTVPVGRLQAASGCSGDTRGVPCRARHLLRLSDTRVPGRAARGLGGIEYERP